MTLILRRVFSQNCKFLEPMTCLHWSTLDGHIQPDYMSKPDIKNPVTHYLDLLHVLCCCIRSHCSSLLHSGMLSTDRPIVNIEVNSQVGVLSYLVWRSKAVRDLSVWFVWEMLRVRECLMNLSLLAAFNTNEACSICWLGGWSESTWHRNHQQTCTWHGGGQSRHKHSSLTNTCV